MLKALLKKQLLEFTSGFFVNGKGKKHTASSRAGFIVLFAVMILTFTSMFFSMAYMMSPVIEEGYGGIYLSVFGILSFLFGLMGSVFMTYNTLYDAKDNDLLMSMPVPSWMILMSRMTGLYITSAGFGAIVLIPSTIVYFIIEKLTIRSFLFSVINIFILPFFVLAVAGVLGFFIALFLSRIRNKSAVTVVVSLAFFSVYYFFSMRISLFIDMIINNAQIVGEWLKKYLFVFYHMGNGTEGNTLSFCLYVLITAILFIGVYIVLSRSFLKLAIHRKTGKKTVYKEKTHKRNSKKSAFFKKEFLYFINTPIYILNSSLGSLLMLVFAVISVIKSDEIVNTLTFAGFPTEKLSVVFCFALCFIAGTNNMTSVSVSLDAKNLWLMKSIPAEVTDIFFGKIMLHFSLTAVPYVISCTIISAFSEFSVSEYLLSAVTGILFILLCAAVGLIINIIAPKTEWINEAAVIKQSVSGFAGMFIGLIFTLIFFVSFMLVPDFVANEVFLAVLCCVQLLALIISFRALKGKYSRKFMSIE